MKLSRGTSINFDNLKKTLPKINEFGDFYTLSKFIESFSQKEMNVLLKFAGSSSTTKLSVDLDSVAKLVSSNRSPELDFGYIKNLLHFKLCYEYVKNAAGEDEINFFIKEFAGPLDKLLESILNRAKNLKYGSNTIFYDRFGNSVLKEKIKAEKKLNTAIKSLGAKVVDQESKKKDNIALTLDKCEGDFEKLITEASKYGVTREECMKYEHFATSGRKGLLRMNIENRIRGKIKNVD